MHALLLATMCWDVAVDRATKSERYFEVFVAGNFGAYWDAEEALTQALKAGAHSRIRRFATACWLASKNCADNFCYKSQKAAGKNDLIDAYNVERLDDMLPPVVELLIGIVENGGGHRFCIDRVWGAASTWLPAGRRRPQRR
jgi:hypothetical protein